MSPRLISLPATFLIIEPICLALISPAFDVLYKATTSVIVKSLTIIVNNLLLALVESNGKIIASLIKSVLTSLPKSSRIKTGTVQYRSKSLLNS